MSAWLPLASPWERRATLSLQAEARWEYNQRAVGVPPLGGERGRCRYDDHCSHTLRSTCSGLRLLASAGRAPAASLLGPHGSRCEGCLVWR
eukprot:scaffold631_cov378-Prasinococcus_capsulatus_cf.AAC.15